MGDNEKSRYEHMPIPTYEEATSSRPTSSSHRGTSEISDDAERQGLLGARGDGNVARNGAYRAPTSDSPRASEDSDLDLHEMTGDNDDDEEAHALRRSIEAMEIMEPEDATGSQRRRFPKPFAQLSHRITTSFRGWRFPRFAPSFTRRLPSIPRIPDEYKPSLPIIARLAALFTIAALVYALFAFSIIPNRAHFATRFDPESVRTKVQSEADASRISDYLEYISSFDHVAGTEGDLFLAEWMKEMWTNNELDKVAMQEFYVYLNYPTYDGRRVAIVDPPEKRWEAQLEEDNVYKENGREKQQTWNWHGNSRNGNVTGPLVYANGGSREDFQKLKDMGINLNGSIALVRYFHTQGDRALKIKAAELAGAAGCIIYSDPKEDGFLKGQPLPDGPWRPSDAVQRGGVSLMSWVVGDVLTPGWASTESARRDSEFDNPGLVNIPSLPLSWKDAQRLLQAIQGHGQKVPEDSWVGGVPDVNEWWTGDPTSPQVNLMNINDENKKQRIWNVHGVIQGMETSQKKIVIGNHRDAWCFGSVDPGSGSAVMMEVVNIFATLKRLGWRPLRTIEFISWDAEEYNLVGSTEYVEEHIAALRADGVAYLNVDVGVSGPNFRAAASPLFNKALMHVLDRVSDPVANVTLRKIWDDKNTQLEGLGAGSDYVAFQDLAGTSSIDFGFEGEPYEYPYHSCYETFEWMSRFGDPGFQYHRLLAQVWSLLILELADRPILPFDLRNYAANVAAYVDKLDKDVADLNTKTGLWDTKPLHEAAEAFVKDADQFHAFDDAWAQQVLGGAGGFETNLFALKRIEHNERLADFESDLLDISGTGEEAPYGVSFFPIFFLALQLSTSRSLEPTSAAFSHPVNFFPVIFC